MDSYETNCIYAYLGKLPLYNFHHKALFCAIKNKNSDTFKFHKKYIKT